MANAIENRGPQLLAVDIFFMTAAVTTMTLRLYVRGVLVKKFGRDDWFMLAATIAFSLYSSFSIAGCYFGTGRHFTDLTTSDSKNAMKCWFFCYLFYAACMILSKLSIGTFLLRITVKKVHIYTVYVAMMFSILAGLAFLLVTLLQCQPVSYFWDRMDPSEPGHCISPDIVIALAALYSSFSVVSDFTFAILPGFLLWEIRLAPRTKYAIIPLLAMGCVASCAVVARFPYLHNIKSDDFLWATVDIAIWSSVEQGLAITAGCLATLRPLLKLVNYKMGWSKTPSGGGGDYSNNKLSNHPSSHQVLGSGPRSRNRDLYDLSEFERVSDEEMGDGGGRLKSPTLGERKSSHRFSLPMSLKNRGGEMGAKVRTVCEKNESQEELHDQLSRDIVVSKDFIVVEEWQKDSR